MGEPNQQTALDYVLCGSNRTVSPHDLSKEEWVRAINSLTNPVTDFQKHWVLSPDRSKPISELVGSGTKIDLPDELKPDTRCMYIGFIGETTREDGFTEYRHLLLAKKGLLFSVFQEDRRKYPDVKGRSAKFQFATNAELVKLLSFQAELRGKANPPRHIGMVVLDFLDNLLAEVIASRRKQLDDFEGARQRVKDTRARFTR